MVNSMVPWIGGEQLMREFLIARFPPHYGKYVEVFGGVGWVLFARKPGRFGVYNDANSNLTNMSHVVKHKPMSFVKELSFLPLNSRAEFDLMLDWHKEQDSSLPYQTEEMVLAKIYLSPIGFREYKELITTQAELGDVRRAAISYKLIYYSYAADGNSFNSQPVNTAQTHRTIWFTNRRLNENGVKSDSETLMAGGNPGKGVIIQNKGFEVTIALYSSPMIFLYLDPPHYGIERQYEELLTLELHYLFREVLGKIEGFFMLPYNDCAFIRELYRDFYTTPFERFNSIAQKYTPEGMLKELVITNYDPNLRLNSQPKQLTLLQEGGIGMTINCFKTVSAEGLTYLPVVLRRFVGIHEDDVVQITGRGGIILINKAEVTAENPAEVLQADFQKEKEDAEKERDQIKSRIKQLLSEGKSLDEVLDEVPRFLFQKGVISHGH